MSYDINERNDDDYSYDRLGRLMSAMAIGSDQLEVRCDAGSVVVDSGYAYAITRVEVNTDLLDGSIVRPETLALYTSMYNSDESYREADDATVSVLAAEMRSSEYEYYPDSDLIKIAGETAYRYDENGNLVEEGPRWNDDGGEIAIDATGTYRRYDYALRPGDIGEEMM